MSFVRKHKVPKCLITMVIQINYKYLSAILNYEVEMYILGSQLDVK